MTIKQRRYDSLIIRWHIQLLTHIQWYVQNEMHMFSQPQNDLDYYDPIEYPMSRICTRSLIHRADRYLLLCRPQPRDVNLNKGAHSSVVVFILTSLLGDIVEHLGEMGLSVGMRHTITYHPSRLHQHIETGTKWPQCYIRFLSKVSSWMKAIIFWLKY